MLITVFKKFTSTLVALAALVAALIPGLAPVDFKPLDSENLRLNFASISDIHVKSSKLSSFVLAMGLEDLQGATLDALVISGDITDSGYSEHWENVASTFAEHSSAENIILATGNHDTWTDDETDGAESRRLFIEYNNKIAGSSTDKVYYSTKINGYTFIVLGSESDHTYATISEEQLNWFDNEMSIAARDGLPIFVINHQPLNGSHGLPEAWLNKEPKLDDGGIGDESEEVEAILRKYENVFFISGHVHNGISNGLTKMYSSVESDGSFHSVNLPCFTYLPIKGTMLSGTGFQFEVYDNEVVIRARNYAAGTWLQSLGYTIPLV